MNVKLCKVWQVICFLFLRMSISEKPLATLTLAYHYNGVIMSALASEITSLMIVYSAVYPRRSSKQQQQQQNTPKLGVTGLCVGNSPVTGEFPTQRTSNVENISI